MKLYLDDERKTPVGWVRVFWPEEAIAWLKTEMVTEISLGKVRISGEILLG